MDDYTDEMGSSDDFSDDESCDISTVDSDLDTYAEPSSDIEEDTVEESIDTIDKSFEDFEEDTVDVYEEDDSEIAEDFEEDTIDDVSETFDDQQLENIEEDIITEDIESNDDNESVNEIDEDLDNTSLLEEEIELEESETAKELEEASSGEDDKITEDALDLEETEASDELEEVSSDKDDQSTEDVIDSEETETSDKLEETTANESNDTVSEEISIASSNDIVDNGKSLRERVIHPSPIQTAKIARNMNDTIKADDNGFKTMTGYRVSKAAHTVNSLASSIASTPPGQNLIDNSTMDDLVHTFDESYSIMHPEERFDFYTPSEESTEIIESHTQQVQMASPSYEVDESVFDDVGIEAKTADATEYKAIIDVTPINNGKWVDEIGNEGVRGESKWCPNDQYTQEQLNKFGVDGIEYKNGYPDFERVSFFGCTLEPDEFFDSDKTQFDGCNFTLLNEIEDNPETARLYNFDEEQMDDLENGKTPYGYTWHHDTTETGRLLLVPTAIHQACRHSGGRSSWGGGSKNR